MFILRADKNQVKYDQIKTQLMSSSFGLNFSYLHIFPFKMLLMQFFPKNPVLIIGSADRKQLKISQTHREGFEIKFEKPRSSMDTLGSGLHNCQIN